jgi:hypothetical protein
MTSSRRWGFSLGATALVAWWFAWHPQHLLVGVTVRATLVPWWYQASAFPPFFLLLAMLLESRNRRIIAFLLAGCSALAAVRLSGLIPLSGHAVFLSAALGYAVATRDRPVGLSAAAGLLLTAWYKLQWRDELFFAVSCMVGATWAGLCLKRWPPAPNESSIGSARRIGATAQNSRDV